jgi:hypothetical protein
MRPLAGGSVQAFDHQKKIHHGLGEHMDIA